jgi:hypothetical protein
VILDRRVEGGDRAIGPIRRRLRILQARGATYDEIVARSNLAWGLRTLGRHDDALQELDVALRLARETGTANVLLEFLEYDRASLALAENGGSVAEIALRHGFRSPTTFALEYRKRFGTAPSRARRATRD